MATTTRDGARCPKCEGMMREDDGDLTCINCGNTEYLPPGGPELAPARGENGRGPLVITVELRPKNLQEFYGGMAAIKGLTKPEWIAQTLGVPAGKANRMANGEVIYTEAALALVEEQGITPVDLVDLIRGTVQANKAKSNANGAQPASRRVGRPRREGG